MATIREHGNKYQVQIRKKGHQPISKSFSKRIDAEKWAATVEGDMAKGEYTDKTEAEKTTLAEVLRAYRDGHASTIKDTEIQARIDAIIARWTACEHVAMTNVNQTLFSDYIGMRKKNRVSGSTINRELGIISAAINRSISNGLPVENVIEKIIRPQNNKSRDRRLESGELRALLRELMPRQRDKKGRLGAGVDNQFIRWIVRFAIETAMRRGELFKMRWCDVDLKKRIVKLYDTKNSENRKVPLSTRALRCLRVVRKLSDADEQRVFATTEAALKKCFERACARAEIEDLHFHDLRHEATSRLALHFDMKELSKVTGHKDPRTLMRYYHPRAEDLAKKLP
jgi:integrase